MTELRFIVREGKRILQHRTTSFKFLRVQVVGDAGYNDIITPELDWRGHPIFREWADVDIDDDMPEAGLSKEAK